MHRAYGCRIVVHPVTRCVSRTVMWSVAPESLETRKKTWSVTPSNDPCLINQPPPITTSCLPGKVRGTGGAAFGSPCTCAIKISIWSVKAMDGRASEKRRRFRNRWGGEHRHRSSPLAPHPRHGVRAKGGGEHHRQRKSKESDTVAPCFAHRHALRCDDTQGASERCSTGNLDRPRPQSFGQNGQGFGCGTRLLPSLPRTPTVHIRFAKWHRPSRLMSLRLLDNHVKQLGYHQRPKR